MGFYSYNELPEDFLVVFQAKSLKTFPRARVKKGDIVYASRMPNMKFYLSTGSDGRNMDNVFESEAIENIDFVRV